MDRANWLAEAVADALHDTLRVRPRSGVPGFEARHYAWPSVAAGFSRRPHFLVLHRGQHTNSVHRHLAKAHNAHWAGRTAEARLCALCHIETA